MKIGTPQYNAFHKGFNILLKLGRLSQRKKEQIFDNKDIKRLVKEIDDLRIELEVIIEMLDENKIIY